jgi:hypothetical protein
VNVDLVQLIPQLIPLLVLAFRPQLIVAVAVAVVAIRPVPAGSPTAAVNDILDRLCPVLVSRAKGRPRFSITG